jgi:hypothetical protein
VRAALNFVQHHQSAQPLQCRLRILQSRLVAGILQVEIAACLLPGELPRQRRLAALARPQKGRHRAAFQPGLHPSHDFWSSDQHDNMENWTLRFRISII